MSQAKTILTGLAVSLALITSAFAAQPRTIDGVVWRDLTPAEEKLAAALTISRNKRQIPPARYDYFNPQVKVIRVHPSKLVATCTSYFGPNVIYPIIPIACAIRAHKPCLIIIPDRGAAVPILIRHEMGHCNGWPSTHPD